MKILKNQLFNTREKKKKKKKGRGAPSIKQDGKAGPVV
jgi:hypothetical protein